MTADEEGTGNDRQSGRLWSRRQALRFGVGGVLGMAGGGLLAACGSSSTTSPATRSSSSSTQPQRRGGALVVGMTGGDTSDTLDGQNIITAPDVVRNLQLYDCLLEPDDNAVPRPALAEEVTPNGDASSWTIRLRQGVVFHNGKELTAEDVIFSLRRITDPQHPLAGASALHNIDRSGMKQVDRYTLTIACDPPLATLSHVLGSQILTLVVPVGFDPHNPVGTGPFKYKSFTPGQQSVFTRNENYWQNELPYVDSVEIIDFADETSQVNALLSGQCNLIGGLSTESLTTIEHSGNGRVVVSLDGEDYTPFTMRTDVPPFNDVRVRQAMRLIVDRPQLREIVFGGYGVLGNDVFGIDDPAYDHALPQRVQDLEQAKFLLKSAGHENLVVQLTTSDIAQGALGMAQVFQQQAKGAGVTVNVATVPVSQFYGPNYLSWTFAQDYYAGISPYYLVSAAQSFVKGAPFNECHVSNATYQSLYDQALRVPDQAAQAPIIHEMCRIDYDQGGYIIPVFSPVIDGASDKVLGLVPSKTGLPLRGCGLKYLSLS